MATLAETGPSVRSTRLIVSTETPAFAGDISLFEPRHRARRQYLFASQYQITPMGILMPFARHHDVGAILLAGPQSFC